MKTHYEHGPHGTACGRASSKTTTNVYRVDCGVCQKRDPFVAAKKVADDARHEAFMAQEPRRITEPWKEGHIICRNCDGDLFRIGDRTCYGHYNNFHCANCGNIESRLTETGMSF